MTVEVIPQDRKTTVLSISGLENSEFVLGECLYMVLVGVQEVLELSLEGVLGHGHGFEGTPFGALRLEEQVVVVLLQVGLEYIVLGRRRHMNAVA